MAASSQVLTVCGLAGQAEVAVQPTTTMAEVKAMAGEQLGIDTPHPDVPWELVLLSIETGKELSDAWSVEASRCTTGGQLVLVRRQKRMYTPTVSFQALGCYTRGQDGSFDNASPQALTFSEMVLRRLDNEDYPWLVDGCEIGNIQMGRFRVVRDDGNDGREVFMNLRDLQPVTEQLQEEMSVICAAIGKPNPFQVA